MIYGHPLSQFKRDITLTNNHNSFQVILDPPAVPPAKSKPRSNSFSHPQDASFDRSEVFMPRTSIIKEVEEEEDISEESIGVRKLSEEIKSSRKKLTHSQSLCTNDSSKALRQAFKKRSMTLGSGDIAVTTIDENKVQEKLKSEEKDTDTDTKNVEISQTVNRDSASQRLSFQGTEYYKCDERPSSFGKHYEIFCLLIINVC